MARFDDETLAKLKTETDIVALIESYGTKLKDRGKDGEMIGLCPIHDDKNPSLVVNRKKNVWNCLGACGKGGDVIEWVMFAEKASFRHAVELLRDEATGSAGGKRFRRKTIAVSPTTTPTVRRLMAKPTATRKLTLLPTPIRSRINVRRTRNELARTHHC